MNELSFLKQCCLDINKMYLFCPSYYSTRLSNMISSPITNYISSMNNKELSFYVVLLHLSLIKIQNEPKEKSLQEINNENSTVFYCPIRNNDQLKQSFLVAMKQFFQNYILNHYKAGIDEKTLNSCSMNENDNRIIDNALQELFFYLQQPVFVQQLFIQYFRIISYELFKTDDKREEAADEE